MRLAAIKGKTSQLKSLFFLAIFAHLLGGCQPACENEEPMIKCQLPAHRIHDLPSAFLPPTDEERACNWTGELLMGDAFAKECDFYRAITCYKRALILLPKYETARRLQINYDLMLCYYLGEKYWEAIDIFEGSDLCQAESDFAAFNNLLLMVYDCYLQTNQEEKAGCVLQIIQKFSPETSNDLSLYHSFKMSDSRGASCLMAQHRESEAMEKDFAFYTQFSKSPQKARFLNALLPGAGYYYVGQRRSALTSFIINTLFIAAAYQFFHRGYPAAGAITASIEAGWYMGGINGAGIEAREFNTRLFEGVSKKILTDHTCFPVLMFETSF